MSNTTQKHAQPPGKDGDSGSFKGKGNRGSGNRGSGSPGASGVSDPLRPMPFNRDAEKAVLSCMLKAPTEVIGRAVETLNPDCFYHPASRILYETLVDMYQNRAGGALDFITLTDTLENRKLLQDVGGRGAVADLLDDVPTPGFFDHYAEILKDKYVLRRIIQDCGECASQAFDDPEAVAELLDDVESRVLRIRDSVEKEGDILPIKDHALKAVNTIEECFKNAGKGVTGLPTGFTDLDALTNGLHGGEMFVVAARPSMGKTSFVMNIVENVSIVSKNPQPTAVFSLEMTAEQLVLRLICSRAKLEMGKLRGGFLNHKSDFSRLIDVANELAHSRIFIDDTPSLSIMEFRAKARRLKKEHDVQLIAIDYLQLMKSNSRKAQDNRQIEIAEISGGIKAVAKELKIPIIVLAQLNRNPEGRGKGKPKLGDLRESGAIEQDADVVGLLYREDYYADSEEEKEDAAGKANLTVAKQRNGPTGDVKLTFEHKLMRFLDRPKEDYEPGGF